MSFQVLLICHLQNIFRKQVSKALVWGGKVFEIFDHPKSPPPALPSSYSSSPLPHFQILYSRPDLSQLKGLCISFFFLKEILPNIIMIIFFYFLIDSIPFVTLKNFPTIGNKFCCMFLKKISQKHNMSYIVFVQYLQFTLLSQRKNLKI